MLHNAPDSELIIKIIESPVNTVKLMTSNGYTVQEWTEKSWLIVPSEVLDMVRILTNAKRLIDLIVYYKKDASYSGELIHQYDRSNNVTPDEYKVFKNAIYYLTLKGCLEEPIAQLRGATKEELESWINEELNNYRPG